MAFGPAQWDKQNGDFKRSELRVSLQAQLNPGWCSSVGEGRPPLRRQSALLRYTPIADAACHCRGNPPQQRDSAAGHRLWQQGRDRSRRARAFSNRVNLTTAGWSLGSQKVTRLPLSWAGHLNRHPKTKPQPPKTEHLRKKGFLNDLCCSRIKHSSLTALNEQQSSQLSN